MRGARKREVKIMCTKIRLIKLDFEKCDDFNSARGGITEYPEEHEDIGSDMEGRCLWYVADQLSRPFAVLSHAITADSKSLCGFSASELAGQDNNPLRLYNEITTAQEALYEAALKVIESWNQFDADREKRTEHFFATEEGAALMEAIRQQEGPLRR